MPWCLIRLITQPHEKSWICFYQICFPVWKIGPYRHNFFQTAKMMQKINLVASIGNFALQQIQLRSMPKFKKSSLIHFHLILVHHFNWSGSQWTFRSGRVFYWHVWWDYFKPQSLCRSEKSRFIVFFFILSKDDLIWRSPRESCLLLKC